MCRYGLSTDQLQCYCIAASNAFGLLCIIVLIAMRGLCPRSIWTTASSAKLMRVRSRSWWCESEILA